MSQISEEIPPPLQLEAAAALAWINAERGSDFRLTGIVDPEGALARRNDEGGFDLSLVLCQGDLCLKEQIRVRHVGDEILCDQPQQQVESDDPPPLLDPPVGSRSGWLDQQRAKFPFVVILFYRGFW